MRAWVIDGFDGIGRLRLAEVAEPVPGGGEVVLQVEFAALNPADAYLAEGQYPARPSFPHVLGRDGGGVVVAIGPKVEGVEIGQRKVILRGDTGVSRWGTFAERAVVSADALIDMPAGWTPEQASCAALVYLTALQALTQWDDLPRDAVVLISGVSGGVGVAAFELATAMGLTVVGLSRSAAKRQALESLGIGRVLDPADAQWRSALRAFLGARKVDLVVDSVGGELLPELIATLGDRGRVSVVGRLAGDTPRFNTATLLFRRIRIGGVAVGSYSRAESHHAWARILELLNRTGARPLVDAVFPFDALPAAFAKLASGPLGKVVVRVE